jgi:hypothetical protein
MTGVAVILLRLYGLDPVACSNSELFSETTVDHCYTAPRYILDSLFRLLSSCPAMALRVLYAVRVAMNCFSYNRGQYCNNPCCNVQVWFDQRAKTVASCFV